ncbi:MAG TPA: hypothetical protein VNP91_07095 [Methylomirabilota bacterium]|nr:hypothetical protein [Methylomirabilota bacterium]
MNTAIACDCMRLDLPSRVRLSDVVLVGETLTFIRFAEARFRVVESFKGEPSAEVRVTISGSDCDYFVPPAEPRIGQRFVIFGTRTGARDTITASRCLGSGLVSDRAAELRQLRDIAR